MSFVVGFNDCDGGGATEIYDYQQQPLGQALMSDDKNSVKPDTENLRSVKIWVPGGSLLIFDSGRYLHRLEPVLGKTVRWTVCSFMALGNDKKSMNVWG
jgi:Carrier-protein-independent halogenase WelO5